MMTSFLLSKDNIELRWKVEVVKNTSTTIVGGDIGQTTVLTLSDRSFTSKCPHGHDLKSINDRMALQRKGSLAFGKSCSHRTNYVNWSIKQMNLGQYKEIRLESNKGIKYKKSSSKSLRHWSWSDINKSIISIAEQHDVHIAVQSPLYKSQRCSSCGYVHNRKGKLFKCRMCAASMDADLNSAINNSLDLAIISRVFMCRKLNSIGFYWSSAGIFSGEDRTVPLV